MASKRQWRWIKLECWPNCAPPLAMYESDTKIIYLQVIFRVHIELSCWILVYSTACFTEVVWNNRNYIVTQIYTDLSLYGASNLPWMCWNWSMVGVHAQHVQCQAGWPYCFYADDHWHGCSDSVQGSEMDTPHAMLWERKTGCLNG